MITVRYTKAQYMARITELEGYHGQLQQHLEKLEELREQVFVFWEDANAEKIGKILDIQIRQVQNSMDRTHDLLIFYKSAVEKLDGANLDVGQVLESALGTLAGLGIWCRSPSICTICSSRNIPWTRSFGRSGHCAAPWSNGSLLPDTAQKSGSCCGQRSRRRSISRTAAACFCASSRRFPRRCGTPATAYPMRWAPCWLRAEGEADNR